MCQKEGILSNGEIHKTPTHGLQHWIWLEEKREDGGERADEAHVHSCVHISTRASPNIQFSFRQKGKPSPEDITGDKN